MIKLKLFEQFKYNISIWEQGFALTPGKYKRKASIMANITLWLSEK